MAGALGGLATMWPGLAHAKAGGVTDGIQQALESGHIAAAMLICFGAGLITSLTPCVYPMIAITVSVFGARESKSRPEAMWLSTAFVLGIASLFTPLGLFAASSGHVFGAFLANPWVLVGLALLFFAFAASMFGAFDVDLPPVLRNKLATVGGVGAKGAFLLGLVSALIAAPCTGPILAALLTWVGTTGDLALGGLCLFAYALGLGVLFWLVGTFSVSLPKSGQWLEWAKSVFGIIMVAAGIYYLRDLIGLRSLFQHTTAWLLLALLALVLGVGMGAIKLSFHYGSAAARIRKGLGIALSVAGLVGLVGYLEAPPPGQKLQWLHDFQSAKALASDEGRPLLVDFGASWCAACMELERVTFADPRVVEEGQRFVAVKVDLSPGKDTPDKRALLASYNQHGLPLVVFHDTRGQEAARVTGFMEPNEMLELMRRVR